MRQTKVKQGSNLKTNNTKNGSLIKLLDLYVLVFIEMTEKNMQ